MEASTTTSPVVGLIWIHDIHQIRPSQPFSFSHPYVIFIINELYSKSGTITIHVTSNKVTWPVHDNGGMRSIRCTVLVTPHSRDTYLVAYSDFSIIPFDLLTVFVLYYELFIWSFCLGSEFVDSESALIWTADPILVYCSILSFQ